MSDSGFIYVLINPSMGELVKIGKTIRDPQSRARELSSVTGVPTPFILAYDAYFGDCSEAEEYIHTLLEQQGFRVARNREFFNAPLNEVIKVILEAQNALGSSLPLTLEETEEFPADDQIADEFLDGLHIKTREPGEDVFNDAVAHYYGLEDILQDYSEAIKLFKHAAKLGASKAYFYLGKMCRDGNGCTQNDNKALEYFKEGARRGEVKCYAEMGSLFTNTEHFENAKKCWKRYFDNVALGNENNDAGWYGWVYLDEMKFLNLPVENIDALRRAKDKVLENAERMIEVAKQRNDESSISYYASLKTEIENTLR